MKSLFRCIFWALDRMSPLPPPIPPVPMPDRTSTMPELASVAEARKWSTVARFHTLEKLCPHNPLAKMLVDEELKDLEREMKRTAQ